jgi:hypothetical protein
VPTVSTSSAPRAYADPLAAVANLPGVPEAVDSARAAVDKLLGHRVLRRKSPEVAAESALRAARSAAALETGAPAVGLEELRDALRKGAPPAPEVAGAVRLFAETGTLLPTWRTAPRQALARMHTLSATGSVATGDLGRPRRDALSPEVPGLPPAPPPEAVAQRLDDLAGLLTAPTEAPAIVVGAVVHGELLALRLFPSSNVLVALAAQRLVLISRGLDPKAVAVPETGHLEQGDDAYRRAATGYLAGSAAGVAAWVRHCAAAVELGAREGVAICEAVMRGA